MGFVSGFIALCIFLLIVVIIAGIIAVISFCMMEIIAITVICLVSKKENRLSNVMSYSVGSAIFFLLFAIFSCISIIFGGSKDSNAYLGDTRYVKINDKYTLTSIDDGPFFIEGNVSLYDVDSFAESKDYLYGHVSDLYFSLNMEDGIVRKDSLFENLDLPEYCVKENIIGAEEFLRDKDKELSRSVFETFVWPFIFALILAFSSSFVTKKLVLWLEIKYKDWKNRRNSNEDENFGNDDTNYLTPVE